MSDFHVQRKLILGGLSILETSSYTRLILLVSYKELTGASWTHVCFFSFYLIAVLWLLNLIVVFLLEAFQAEMNLEASTRSVDGDDKEERREQRRPVGYV